ncbi:MAG: ISAs1 family transposase [Actinomycetota bacterium]
MGPCPGLREFLAKVADPRARRGVRHSLVSVLLVSVAAVLAGARSFTAIGEWAADAPPEVLGALGVRFDPLTGQFQPPGEATIRRVLESIDAGGLDAAVTSWLASGPAPPGRRAVAVNGKALRGTRHASSDGQATHLLAVLDQQAGTVLAQTAVDGKTNEITRFAPLLQPLDLAGCVVTADALHTQREHAEFLVAGKNADYILVVKGNQPGLHAQLRELPWKDIPAAHQARNRGHGRAEHRTLRAVTVTAGLAFPHAAQALRVTRRTRPLTGGKWRTVTIHAITSLAFGQATPADLAGGSAGTGSRLWPPRAARRGRRAPRAARPAQRRRTRGRSCPWPADRPCRREWPAGWPASRRYPDRQSRQGAHHHLLGPVQIAALLEQVG